MAKLDFLNLPSLDGLDSEESMFEDGTMSAFSAGGGHSLAAHQFALPPGQSVSIKISFL